jgi:hypothetical protein
MSGQPYYECYFRSTLRPSSPPQAFINPMPTQQKIIEYYNLQLENPRNQDVDDAFGDVDDEKGIKIILKMMKLKITG